MYDLDSQLQPWIVKYEEYLKDDQGKPGDDLYLAYKILYEAALELYFSILAPGTSRSTKAVLTRCLIECYADVFAIFRHDKPLKQAKRYTKYALNLDKYFKEQALNYIEARDAGGDATRPFELARKAQACWNGADITTRVSRVDNNTNIIGFYEFFSLFAHVNPVRQVYLTHFDEPFVDKYYSHMMLTILKTFTASGYASEDLAFELDLIISDYALEIAKLDMSPKRK